MGNNRNLLLLVLAVVVLGGIYTMSSRRRPSLDTSGGFVDLVEGTLSTDDVRSISIGIGGEGFTMADGEQGWAIEDHFGAAANLNKIRTLLGSLESVVGEFRSRDDSVLPSYALDDSSAYRLSVLGEDAQPMVELLIGKRSGSGCFVRFRDEPVVYFADHNFLGDLGVWGDERPAPDVKAWVDLLAFEVKRDDVMSMRVEGKPPLLVERELVVDESAAADTTGGTPPPSAGNNYEWRVNGDFLASRTKGDAMLSTLVSIRGQDVLARGENPPGSGLDNPERVVVNIGGGTTNFTLLFGNPVEDMTGQVWFRVEGEELIWAVPDYVKDNLFKKAKDLRPE